MKSIILPEYNANIIRAMKSLAVIEKQIPEPEPEQVLIKVAAAPCNPSDIAFMRGIYNVLKPVPVTMGFECGGMVVDTGGSPDARKLMGKRVSCFSQEMEEGTWSEYFVSGWKNCIILDPEMDMEQAGTLCINPFTAYALFQMAGQKGCGTIIQNGASGQVGIFIRNLAKKSGMNVINIVRKKEHVPLLNTSGEHIVLNSADPEFDQKLRVLAYENNACIGFDAVGGDMAGRMINAMPDGSELVVYGGLSGKPIGSINTLDIIFRGKSIKGFSLMQWKEEIGLQKFQAIGEEIQQFIIKGTLQPRIQGRFKLDEVQSAMEQYIRNMSAGKILFIPQG